MSEEKEILSNNYMDRLIKEDLKNGTLNRPICTRFPPEPNGYLHIGSVYAIHLNYMVAQKFNENFNLRFDDTNPLKEDSEYVHAIIEDINWLGYTPGNRIFYGSDYSNEIFNAAIVLIKKGKAYICELSPEEITEYRGTLTDPGKISPYRNRSIEDQKGAFTILIWRKVVLQRLPSGLTITYTVTINNKKLKKVGITEETKQRTKNNGPK